MRLANVGVAKWEGLRVAEGWDEVTGQFYNYGAPTQLLRERNTEKPMKTRRNINDCHAERSETSSCSIALLALLACRSATDFLVTGTATQHCPVISGAPVVTVGHRDGGLADH